MSERSSLVLKDANGKWWIGHVAISCAAVVALSLFLKSEANQTLYTYSPSQIKPATNVLSLTAKPSALNAQSISAMQLAQPDQVESTMIPTSSAESTLNGQTAIGCGLILAGVVAIVHQFFKSQSSTGSWARAEMAMATYASEKTAEEAPDQRKRIAGIKPRPAGYRHQVSRGYQLEEVSRPRRNRRHPALRSFMRETHMVPANFIMPLFIHDEDYDTPINAMPGCSRLCAASVLREVGECVEQGVNMFILFPKIPDELKTPDGRQCYDSNDIVMRTLKLIKGAYPDVIVCTDIALDPYNTDGHDGIVDEYTGEIINDITVEQLCKQAVAQARAGSDIVAPSDMQDGRIGAIRDALDAEGFTQVGIMSYCAKYASAFYGPFREALDSNPSFGDKSTYQMDPANRREALREIELDEAEGADILLVKPGLPYLDVIMLLKENSALPIAAYQVSGEYSMIKAAAMQGFVDEEKIVLESLLSLRRAGSDVILTYFAKDAAKWMNNPNGWWQKKIGGKI